MTHPVPLFKTKSGLSFFFNEDTKPAGENCRYSIDITQKNGDNVTGMWLTANSPILVHLKALASLIESGKTPEKVTQEIIKLNQLLLENRGYSSVKIAQAFAEFYADDLEAAKKACEALEEVKKDWGNRKDDPTMDVDIFNQIQQFIEDMISALKQVMLQENQAGATKKDNLYLVLRVKA